LSETKVDPAKAAAKKKPAPRVRVKRAVGKTAKPAAKKEVAKHWAPKNKPAAAHGGGKSGWKKPAQSAVVAHSGGPKPSPAISKQGTGSN
jgi:hypothetical protein